MKQIMRILSIVLIITFIASLCTLFVPFTKVEAATRGEIITQNIPEAGIYLIKNKASGKYLNVNLGTDANGTNVIQWSYDGSIEQKWRIVKNGSEYKFYAMCSSNGYNRVLDVLRTGGLASGSLVAGNNVDIWAPNDPEAQTFYIYPMYRAGQYVIELGNGGRHYHLVLTASDNNNGSGVGTLPTSQGNVYVSQLTDVVYDNQLWILEKIG